FPSGIQCAHPRGTKTDYENTLPAHHAARFGDVFLNTAKIMFIVHTVLTRCPKQNEPRSRLIAPQTRSRILALFPHRSTSFMSAAGVHGPRTGLCPSVGRPTNGPWRVGRKAPLKAHKIVSLFVA